MERHIGGCTCGNLRFVAHGRPVRVGICHCMDCRRHHGALFYAAAVFARHAVEIEGEAGEYRGRYFCERCGASVFAQSGNEVEVHLGAFDEANRFKPTYECWTLRREAWLPEFPDMKRHARGREE